MASDPSLPRTPSGAVDWRLARMKRVEAWIKARLDQGLGYEPMPDPTGPMPKDDPLEVVAAAMWDGPRWEVWQRLHSGESTAKAAKNMGIGPGTVKEWRAIWRLRYGQSIRATSRLQASSDQRYRKVEDSRSPEARRRIAVEELDEAAVMVLRTVQRYLELFDDNVERLKAEDPKTMMNFLDLGQRLFDMSAQLNAGHGIGSRPTGNPADPARAALTALTGGKGRKTGSKTSSAVDPAAASAGLAGLKGTLASYRQAVQSHQGDAAG